MDSPKAKTQKLTTDWDLISHLSYDILADVLFRLPTESLAAALRVKRLNAVCKDRVLSYPKFVSAVSLNSDLEHAVKEVQDEVFSKAILPQFLIACIGRGFSLQETHKHLLERYRAKIPIITTVVPGIVGREALTGEYLEVVFNEENGRKGILLLGGYLPGMAIEALPMKGFEVNEKKHVFSKKDSLLDDRMDALIHHLTNYNKSYSDHDPSALLVFGDNDSYTRRLMQKLDCLYTSKTIIFGSSSGKVIHKCGESKYEIGGVAGAVVLIFSGKSSVAQDVGFHLAMSDGLMPCSTMYGLTKVGRGVNANATMLYFPWKELDQGHPVDHANIINKVTALDDPFSGCCVAIKKKRSCIVHGGLMSRTFLEFHGIKKLDDEFLLVDGTGIDTRDRVQFWHRSTDLDMVRVVDSFSLLFQYGRRFVSCLLFSSLYRTIDSSPLRESFPSVCPTGLLCYSEVGRGICHLSDLEIRRCVHLGTAMYLVISFSSFTF